MKRKTIENAMGEAPHMDDRRLWDLWLTGLYQPTVVAADDAGLFDALDEHPATHGELAERLGLDERATGIFLRLLASLGLLVVRHGRFHLTPETRSFLVHSSPWYWGPILKVGVNEAHRKTLCGRLRARGSDRASNLDGTPLRSGDGRSADAWAAGDVSLAQAREIAARMHAHSLSAASGVAHYYDFGAVRRMLDVGGGSGCFMLAAAQAHAHLHCTVMDLPAMCEVASEYLSAGEVTGRVDTVAVDMFRQPWPSGYDAIFLSNVWHDWNARTCRWLAERAFDALPSGGRLMLHEMLLDDSGTGPTTAAAFSMLMLLATQGQQYTFGELEEILGAAGFVETTAVQTHPYYSVVTAYKR